MASAGAGIVPGRTRTNRLSLITLTCHAFLVTAVTAGYALTMVEPHRDANIGGGLLLYGGLGGLGLPWSVLVFRGVFDNHRDNFEAALIMTFAVANLLIHALLALYLTRRSAASRRRLPVNADAMT